MSDPESPNEVKEAAEPPVLGYLSQSDGSVSAVVWCRLLAVFMFGWGLQEGLIGAVGAIDYLVRMRFDVGILAAALLGAFLPAGVCLSWLGTAGSRHRCYRSAWFRGDGKIFRRVG